MIFGKKYNVHFDFYAGIIISSVIAIEWNISNPQVNKWKGRDKKKNLTSWICMGFEAMLT